MISEILIRCWIYLNNLLDGRASAFVQQGRTGYLLEAVYQKLSDGNPIRVHVREWKMKINPDDPLHRAIAYGNHEPQVVQVLEAELTDGDIVFDVGAHIGFHTIIASRKVGEGGHVFAFEPISENAVLLEENIGINGLENVSVERVAVSHLMDDTVNIFVSSKESGIHSYAYGQGLDDSVDVPSISIDGYCSKENVPSPDLIKIDAEGAEMDILEGMVKTISDAEEIMVICEIHSNNYDDFMDFASNTGLDTELISSHPDWGVNILKAYKNE